MYPHSLDPADQIWFRCWIVDRNLLCYHCPNILNDI